MDFRFEWQDHNAGQRAQDAQIAARERGEQTNALGAFLAAVETDSMVANVVRRFQTPDYDPNYSPDVSRWREKFKAYGIPEEHSGVLAGAVSEAHEDQLIGQIRDRMSAQQYLADAGYTGAGMRVAVGLLDPASLALNAIPMGWAVKGGAVAAAVKTGLATGAMNAGQEAALVAMDPTYRDSKDIVEAGLAGFVLGAPIGGVLGTMYRRAAHDTWLGGTLKSVTRTPEGERAVAAIEAPQATLKALPPPYRKVEGTWLEKEAPGWAKQADVPEKAPIEGEFVDLGVEKALPNPNRPRTNRPKFMEEPTSADPIPEFSSPQMREAFLKAEAAKAAKAEATDQELRDLILSEYRQGEWAKADAARKAEIEKAVDRAWAERNKVEGEKAANAAEAPPEGLRVGDEVVIEVDGKDMTGKVTEELPNGDYLVDTGDTVRRVKLDDTPDEETGGFIKGGSIGSGQRVLIEDPRSYGSFIKIGRWNIPLRFDLASHFDRWGEKNPLWRKLGRAFVDDPAPLMVDRGPNGEVIPRAREIAVSEYAEMDFKRSITRQTEAMYEAYDEFAKRTKLGASKFDPRTERDFFEGIGRVMRDPDGDLARSNPEMVKAANEIRSQNRALLARLKKAGWEGAENINADDLYLMRKWDLDTIGRIAADPVMRRKIDELVVGAISKVRPDLDPAKAQTIGKAFVKKLFTLRTGTAKRMGFLDDGGRARMAEILRQGDVLDNDEVENILDWVYGMQPASGDKGQISRLKKRTFMDENHSIQWTDPDGNARKLTISDLLVNDVRELQSIYTKQMAGATAFAKKGYRSLKDIQNAIDEAVEADNATGVSQKAMEKRRRLMEGAVRAIMGQPFNEAQMLGDNAARWVRALRNINFITYMGQVGMASLPEYAHVLATHLNAAAYGSVPSYRGIIRMARAGKVPKDLVKDLKEMGIVANEAMQHKPVWKLHAGDKWERLSSNLEGASAKGTEFISRASGIQLITRHQREMLAGLYTRKLVNLAVSGKTPDTALLKRLAANGLEGDDLDGVLERLKEFAETDGKEIVGIDHAAWEAASPRTYDLFRNAVHRESHRSIQEVTLGGTAPWMHNELGKVMLQFRSFMLTAWVKQTMFGIANFDMQTAMTWAFSSMIAGAAYAAQTSLNYANDEEKRNKLLTPKKIALAAFQRAGFSSLVPMVVDSVAGFTTGDPVFAHGRTTGLASGITGNPSVATLTKLGTVTSGIAQDALTDDHLWLKKDVQAATGLLPNLYGLRTMLNGVTADLPTRNYLRQFEDD